MTADPVQTRPARQPPPAIRRYAAEILAGLAQRTKYVDPQLAGRWTQIVGPELAELCRPGRMTGGRSQRTLEVIAPTGAAAARAAFEAEAIRERVNAYLGPRTVARVTVRQGGAKLSPSGASDDETSPLGQALGRFRASLGARKGG